MPIPLSVTHAELNEALAPLCALLGTSVHNFFADPGIRFVNKQISFAVPVLHEEYGQRARVDAAKAWGKIPPRPLPPHPQGHCSHDAQLFTVGEGESIEWAYGVEVEVI